MISGPDRWTRRCVLGGVLAGGATWPGQAARGRSEIVAAVPAFRQPGDTDDTDAATRALRSGKVVHFPAGGGSAPDGAYLLRSVRLWSGVTLTGDGPRSVLRALPDAVTVLEVVTDAPDQVATDITLRDLRVEGLVNRTGFREHWNLVSLSGVSGVRIERLQFIGFAGDGLYLGAEHEGIKREPRVIREVLVRDCLFDGVNNDNRNAISVTGGADVTIDRCRFRRCTRANMPGPIDFEPDPFDWYRLERLRVTNCDFEACGGNVGQVAIVVPAVVPPPQRVLVSGNSFRSYHGSGGDIAVTINRQPNATTPSMDCVIERNVGTDGNGGVQIYSGKGIVVRGNRWTHYRSRSFLGYAGAANSVMNVVLADWYDQCGWSDGIALGLYNGEGIRVEGARFARTGNGGPGSAPLYLGQGRIRRLALIGNDLRSNPASRGLVIVERGADYLPGTARIAGNLLPAGRSLAPL